MFDPIGPGTKAWDLCDEAIRHGVNGRHEEAKEAMDAMTRELVANGQGPREVAEWEAFVAKRVSEPELDDMND